MAELYTVDASVFLNAFLPHEPGHDQSFRLLSRLRDRSAPIIVPTLLIAEVAAVVSRGQDDPASARQFATAIAHLPQVVLVPLDLALAEEAADVAAQQRLRGSDAVYAAVALRFGCTLITLDRQQRERVAEVIPTAWPSEVH